MAHRPLCLTDVDQVSGLVSRMSDRSSLEPGSLKDSTNPVTKEFDHMLPAMLLLPFSSDSGSFIF